MEVEFHEEVSPVGGAKPAATGNALRARGQVHESVTVGSEFSEPVRDESAGSVEQESVTVGKGGRGFGLSPTARKMLENIDKHGTVSDEAPTTDSPPATTGPAAAVAPTTATPAEQSSVAAAAAPSPTSTAPVKSTEDAIAEHKARADRLTEHNQKLVTELEQLRARPARGEMSAREKALDEAERTIMEDSIGALRRVYMTALGVDKPDHPDVDKHLTWLYHDLTEKELGVPLDPALKALRETERNKHLLARDRRERTTEAQRPVEQPAVDPEAAAKVPIVARLIAEGDHATKFPLLRNLSADFDGMKPEELLWSEIRRGLQTGEYANPTTPAHDQQLIDQASRKIETHYQVLAEKIAKATQKAPAASTATPTQAAVATDSKAEPQANGPRTITNASASVAPATTPAAKPASTETTTKKPWRNEKERIRMLAAKHFGDA